MQDGLLTLRIAQSTDGDAAPRVEPRAAELRRDLELLRLPGVTRSNLWAWVYLWSLDGTCSAGIRTTTTADVGSTLGLQKTRAWELLQELAIARLVEVIEAPDGRYGRTVLRMKDVDSLLAEVPTVSRGDPQSRLFEPQEQTFGIAAGFPNVLPGGKGGSSQSTQSTIDEDEDERKQRLIDSGDAAMDETWTKTVDRAFMIFSTVKRLTPTNKDNLEVLLKACHLAEVEPRFTEVLEHATQRVNNFDERRGRVLKAPYGLFWKDLQEQCPTLGHRFHAVRVHDAAFRAFKARVDAQRSASQPL